MKKLFLLTLLCLATSFASAGELRVSAKEPVIVVAPDHWKSAKEEGPFEAYKVEAPAGRNAVCLVSVLDKDHKEFADPKFLQKLVRGDSRPYVKSADELAKIPLKEAKIAGGLGFYANFVDPDLVGKPVKPGSYKTGTPMILSLGSNYLIKVTILCDEIDGADYKDAMKIVESIKIKK